MATQVEIEAAAKALNVDGCWSETYACELARAALEAREAAAQGQHQH